MEFERYFDRIKKHKTFLTDHGNDFLDEYAYEMNDGVQTLVHNGQTNVYEKIQVAAEGADVESIVNRFIKSGDTSDLTAVKGFYADTTRMPSTYAELFSRIQDAENVFDQLDPKMKNAFDNNYKKFWSMYGTADFENIVNSITGDSVVTGSDEENKSSESEEK